MFQVRSSFSSNAMPRSSSSKQNRIDALSSQSLPSRDSRQIYILLYIPPAAVVQYAANWTHHFLTSFAFPPVAGTTIFTLSPERTESFLRYPYPLAGSVWQSLQWRHCLSFLLLPTITALVQAWSPLVYCRDCWPSTLAGFPGPSPGPVIRWKDSQHSAYTHMHGLGLLQWKDHKAKTAGRQAHGAKFRWNKGQASKSLLPIASHWMIFIPPVTMWNIICQKSS